MITGFWAAWAKAPSSDGSRAEARRPEETWRTRGEKMSSGISRKIQLRVKQLGDVSTGVTLIVYPIPLS